MVTALRSIDASLTLHVAEPGSTALIRPESTSLVPELMMLPLFEIISTTGTSEATIVTEITVSAERFVKG
jgi:hypothetical protein